MDRTTQYIGSTVKFPFSINADGVLEVVSGSDAIVSSCLSIISTPVGERYFLPEFGCRLSIIQYRPYTDGLKALIESVIEEALSTWEGRCRYIGTSFDETEKDKGIIVLNISVEIKATYEIKSFTFPYYTKLIN
jgi:hypothetical protein